MKRVVRSIFFVCIALLALGTQAIAQSVDSLKVKIAYVADASSADVIRPNQVAIREMQDSLNHLKDVVKASFVEVNIIGSSSPEGKSERNNELSIARAMTLLHTFGLDSLDSSRIRITPKIDTWKEVASVVEAENWKYRATTLPIMKRSDLTEKQKEWQLRQLGSEVWKGLDREYLCRSRYATMVVKYVKPEPIKPEPVKRTCDSLSTVIPIETGATDNEVLAPIPTAEATPPVVVEEYIEPWHQIHMAIKTNTLGLAVGVTNFGFEIGFGQFSIDVPAQYSPYTIGPKHNLRFLSIQPEFRRWLGREAMKGGHFIGMHTHVMGFNVRMGDSMRYQDPNRAIWGLGFSYGYQMPLTSKSDKWMVEFNIGAGYANIQYDVFDEGDTLYYLYTGHKHWFGPTRLGIKISYRLDVNTKKKQKEVAEK